MRTNHGTPICAAVLSTILGLVAIGLQGCDDAAASQADATAAKAFVNMVCTHIANRTVELKRRDWLSQLWDGCHDYTKAILHEKCLEVGIEGIVEADANATAFMMEQCLQVAHDCRDEGSSCVAETILDKDNNYLGKHGLWGHYPDEEQLVGDMFNQSLQHAKQEADALSKELDGMSKDEKANFTGDQEAKDMVIREWCIENAQGGLQHQMRVDVITPLFNQCRRFGAIAAGSEASGGPPRKAVETKCLEVGAADIQKVADEFVNRRLDSCTSMVQNYTSESLLELQHAVITLRRQFGLHYDALFEQFRHILATSRSEAKAMLGEVKAAPANIKGEEEKFNLDGGRLDLEADTMPLANLFPVLFVIMAVLIALTTGGTAVLSAWRRARALRTTRDNEEIQEPLGHGFSISL